jgi:hypothetical protein
MRNSKEWIAILNGTRIDSNGFYCGAACVTAYNKKEAIRLLSKAKMHYFGTYKINKEVRRNTNIYANYKKINMKGILYIIYYPYLFIILIITLKQKNENVFQRI